MKTVNYIFRKAGARYLLMAAMAFAGVTACEDDSKTESLVDVGSQIRAVDWKITYFFDETDETHHFTGYRFHFNNDGTVVATKDQQTVSGTWSLPGSASGQKLLLDFGLTEPFDELNDDWDMKELSSTKMVLEDVSGGSGEVDYLTFEK